jgi:hypothetical protein
LEHTQKEWRYTTRPIFSQKLFTTHEKMKRKMKVVKKKTGQRVAMEREEKNKQYMDKKKRVNIKGR